MKAGEISIDLTIDDKDFSIKLRNGEQILSRFTRQLDSTARSTKVVENHFSSLSTRFRHFMIMVASTRFALLDINQVFLTLPRAILQTSGEFERMTKLLEGLSTEADRASDALRSKNFIIGFAKTAPFEIQALTDSFVKMKSGGLDPMDGSFKSLINAVAQFGGTSDVLKRASIAIQQMAGKGVISMEELRQQLGEAVPTAMRMMADGMGVSMAELAKKVSLGIVTAGPVLFKMFEVMRVESAMAAEEMMNTWVGATSRLKTEWDLFKNNIGEGGFSAEATRIVRELAEALNTEEFKKFAKEISAALVDAVKAIESVVKMVVEYRDVLLEIGKVMLTIWGTGKVMGGLGAIVGKWKELGDTVRATEARLAAAHRSEVRSILRTAEVTKTANLEQAAAAQRKYSALIAEAANYEKAYKRHLQAVATHERAAQMAIAGGNKPAIMGGFGSTATANAQAAREMANAAAARKAADEIKRMGEANLSAAANARKLATEARQAAAGTAQQARDAIGAAAANARWAAGMSRLGTVFNALGGWVTAVGLVVTAGIAIWQRWGEAAEKSARQAILANKAVEDARKGRVTSEGFENTLENTKKIRTRIETLNNRRGGTLSDAEKVELKRLQAELEVKEESIELQRKLLERSEEEETLAFLQQEQERRLVDVDVQTKEIMKEIDRRYGASPVDKEQQAARLKERDEAMRNMYQGQIASINAQAAIYAEEIKTGTSAAGKLTDAEIGARRRWLASTQDQINEVNEKMERFFDRSNQYQGGKGGAGGKPSSGPSPLEALLDRVADKMAVINGELDKKGSGDLQKILSDLEQIDPSKMIANGKRMTKQEVIDKIMPGLIQGEWRLEFEKSFDQISETIGSEMLRVSAELDGGRGSIERLRNQLNELGLAAAAAGEPDRVGRVTQLIDRLNELQAEQSKLSLRDISLEFTNSISSIQASLSDDPNDSIYAKWSEDIAKFQQKIVDAKLDTQQALEAQKLFADYVKVTYERLQRDTETPMQKMAREWANTTKNMQEATASWVSDASEAFTDFVMTGKADFSSLAESIIRDLIRMQLQAAMGNMIKGVTSGGGGWLEGAIGEIGSFISSFFANGGVMTEFGSVPLRKYANGGIAYKPQMAIFGEGSRPEAYVPLPDGRTIPVTMTGGGQSAGTIVNVNVHEAPGTRTSVQQSQDDQGNMTLDIMIEQIEGKMASNLARGRSQIGTTMENVYGLNRAAGARR